MATEKRLIDATPIIDECKECSAIEWNRNVYTTWAEAEEDFMERLLDAPIVDAVEVVHGYWRYYSTTMQECSNCHRHTARHKFKYCPHCGAVMEDKYNEPTD